MRNKHYKLGRKIQEYCPPSHGSMASLVVCLLSLWMAHKTIYGINANIILGWRHKFSHLHALNLGNDFWSISARQLGCALICVFVFAVDVLLASWPITNVTFSGRFNCFVYLIVYCVELHPLRHWHWQINICKLTNEYPELKSSLFNGADWNKWGQMFGSENGPESKDMIYKERKWAKNIKEIKIYTLAKISKKARK